MTDLRKAAEMALEFVEWFGSNDHSIRPKHKAPEIAEALRKSLAQSKWVGLTQKEIDQCFEQCVIKNFNEDGTEQNIVSTYQAGQAIEDKLKEKNGG